ncbi:MAG: hypothetical protein J6J16_05260 [Lachnospiraceae bacterium]|nr:hypothetical protein [Lachnospiraceae bacterium]
MRKAVKKVLAVTTLAALMSLSLVGCAKKTECEGCGEEKKCKEYEMTFMGETESGWLCKDCAEDTEAMCESMGIDFKKK